MYAWSALSMARTGHVWLRHVASCCVTLHHVASCWRVPLQILGARSFTASIDSILIYFASISSPGLLDSFRFFFNSSEDKPHEHGSHLRASSRASSWKGLIRTQTHTQKRSSVSVHCVYICLCCFDLSCIRQTHLQ